MSYRDDSIDRIRQSLSKIENVVGQKKFGGISFMVEDFWNEHCTPS